MSGFEVVAARALRFLRSAANVLPWGLLTFFGEEEAATPGKSGGLAFCLVQPSSRLLWSGTAASSCLPRAPVETLLNLVQEITRSCFDTVFQETDLHAFTTKGPQKQSHNFFLPVVVLLFSSTAAFRRLQKSLVRHRSKRKSLSKGYGA